MISSLLLTLALALSPGTANADLEGAWQSESGSLKGTMIVSGDHFSIAWYTADSGEFVSTMGGKWSNDAGASAIEWEFNTAEPERVGTTDRQGFDLQGPNLSYGERTWQRIDAGDPGDLEGAWLITGRKRDGEITTSRPGARRTMKILSGTRFQWIAFNVETKEFFGTGGGTYTTTDGRYTENIEFFSRDATRVGASLPFNYDIVDGTWHHEGKSSKGDPMYEVWTRRRDLGI